MRILEKESEEKVTQRIIEKIMTKHSKLDEKY